MSADMRAPICLTAVFCTVVAAMAGASPDTDAQIAAYQKLARTNPDNLHFQNTLAGAYIQKMRETTDFAYIDRASRVVEHVLSVEPGDDEARRLRSEIALERHQFGKSISSFGAIKAKLAEQAIRTWVGESMIYRTLGMIEAGIGAVDAKDMDARLRAIEEYAAECSIIKVALSEYCDYVVDEMVQIYGGYGYSADYPAERAYRDSRINRIFEGTNEINRMLIPGRLMKSALSGRLALLPAAQALMDEVLSPQLGGFDDDDTTLAAEQKLAQNAKKVALMTLGTAAQKYMMKLGDQQEILMGIADVIMDTYAMETAVLRARKLVESQGEGASARYLDMTRVFCNDAVERIEARAKNTLAGMSEGDELRMLLAALRRFTKLQPMNTIAARQRIADEMIKGNKYTY